MAAGAAVLLLGACGREPIDGPGDAAPPAAEWTTQPIAGEPGADREPQLATSGDEVVFIGVTEDDRLWSAAGMVGTVLSEGEPLDTGVGFLSLGGTARLGNRWLTLGSGGRAQIDGDDQLTFDARAFRSEDGLAWEALDVSGFSGPVDIEELVVHGDRWVAVGNRRSAVDPGGAGFAARAWWSTDGEAWTEVDLGASAADSVASDVVAVGDDLIAVGTDAGEPALWRSSDGGEQWERLDDPALAALSGLRFLAADSGVVLVSGNPRTGPAEDESVAGSVLLRSTDGGAAWQEAAQPPPTEGTEPWLPLFGGGGGPFFATTSDFFEGWRQPEVCYADIDRCRMDSVEALYASGDGDAWDRIDTTGLGDGEAGEVWQITTTQDGAVIALTWDDGLRLSTWPAGVDLPTMDEPTLPEADVTILADDAEPEVGVVYAEPFGIHCGMDWLFFGDEAWQRSDDGPDVETGAGDSGDPDWPIAQQMIYGFATLTEEGTVEYSIGDGEVIATYERATEEPPGCA